MRYRRLSYRYAVVLAANRFAADKFAADRPQPGRDVWRVGRLDVRLAQPRWRPAADVYETAATITVMVDLAGVEQDDLDVLLFEDAVVVEGERRLPPVEAAGVFHTAEIRHGPFRLELPLPASIDPDRVEAHYDKGLLQMIFKKSTATSSEVGARHGD